MKLKTITDSINEAMSAEFKKWRKANVTYRGSQKDTPFEGITKYDGVMGRGLYSTPISNKSMAKGYGKLFIMVGAIPKNPVVVDSINAWEMFEQKLIMKVLKTDFPDKREFNKKHKIDEELVKLGYDGVIIKGREMVLYNPNPDEIEYFESEDELEKYYETSVKNG